MGRSLWISVLFLVHYTLCKPPPYTGNKINIHIMTHTHDDTGWVYTTDEYYVHIVQWIFYTLIPTLENDPNHKFTYVEMAFFQRWWQEQTDEMKQRVLKLLNNRQLQLNLGGWCMNDEANPNAASEIRQMTDGAQFILYNFGQSVYPNTGWHIDPFGSSYVTAGMWSQIGFDTFGINRISYWDKAQRKKDKTLEFIWKGSNSLGEESWIWTHIMDSYYCTPNEIYFSGLDGQWFDKNEKWIVTNELPSYPTNYVEMSQKFVADARNRNSWYRHNHILIPFGCDFAHFNSYMSYIQMDKLIKYINSNSTYNASVFYSSLYDYTKAINALNLTWDLEENLDFFVYQSSAHQWWSGYFTSRPDLKSFVRSRENYLRTAEFLYTFSMNLENIVFNASDAMTNITKLRRAVDVGQHHDGITGTERDHVYIEYMVQMETGTRDTAYFMNTVVSQILAKKEPINTAPFLLFNAVETIQKLTNTNMAPLILFNSLAWNVTQLIRVGTNRTDIVVYDENSNLVLSQINPVATGSRPFENEPAKYSLFFIANNLLPLSFTTYFIKSASTEPVHLGQISQTNKIGNDSFYTLTFDTVNGKLSQITNNALGKTFPVSNNFFHYGSNGDPLNDNLSPDDPYKFRPAQDNRYQMLEGQGMTQVTLHFRQFANFSSSATVNPGFIFTTHIGTNDFKNNYMAHVCDIDEDNTEFTFQFYGTVTKETWPNSEYYTDWIVFGNEYESDYQQQLLQNKHYSSQLINKANTAKTNVTIDLSKYAFTSSPMMVTSIRKIACNDTVSWYSVTIVSLSNTKAIVQVSRVDSSVAWIDNVYIDFIVWPNTKTSDNSLSNEGIFAATVSSDIKHHILNVSFNNGFIVNEPIVLSQVTQTKSSSSGKVYEFAITAVNNNYKSVSLSMELLNPSSNAQKENIDLNIIYWSFERVTMKENVSSKATNVVYSGILLDELQQTFRTNYSQTYRVVNTMKYNDLRYIENDVILDWIDNRTNFIQHFEMTDMHNNFSLFTAQNSLEYVERKYNSTCDERVACNFFPTSSQAYLQNVNDNTRFSSILDEAHAVGMMYDGDHQLLLQRRCAGIDNDPWNGDLFQLGCLSPSNHSEPKIYLLYDDAEMVSFLNRRLYVLQQYKPLPFTNVYNGNDINAYKSQFETKWSAINASSSQYYPQGLPVNIHLMDLRYAYSDQNVGENKGLILQLWNMFEVSESKQYSVNESVAISDLFDFISVNNVTEMTLNANVPLKNLDRLKWNVRLGNDKETIVLDKDKQEKKIQIDKETASLQINMTPRNIRTFIVNQNIHFKPNT